MTDRLYPVDFYNKLIDIENASGGGEGGSDVSVVNTPNVAVTNTPSVTISGTPSVNAAITGTPTVNIGAMPNVTVGNTPAVTISGTPSVNATITNALTPSINNFSYDAGGRSRVSQLTTLMDGKILNADNAFIWENVGTGTATFTNNKLNMAVTAGQYLIRRTRRFSPYFSGKSQVIDLTVDNFHPESNLIKRKGYFSSNAVATYDSAKDGFWLESDGVTMRIIAQKAGTETLNVALTSWTGYASLAEYQNLSTWQNFTVGMFDFLWLGGAWLRFFLKVSTGFVLAHVFHYAGTSQDTFIKSPNQPVRYEIRSTTGAGSMRYICSQVATEGSVNESGQTLSLFNATAISCNNVGTIYALKSVRKTATYRDNAIQVISIDAVNAATSDAGMLMLIINPTLSAPINYANNSMVSEGTPTNQTVTAGTGRVIISIPVGTSSAGTTVMKDNFLSYLSQGIDNTMDEYVLCYMPITATQNVVGVITLKEYL